MPPEAAAQLQRTAQWFRAEVAAGRIPSGFRIEGLTSDPIEVEVQPDGSKWFVKIASGERVFADRAVDPLAFQDNLYTVLFMTVRWVRTPEAKAS